MFHPLKSLLPFSLAKHKLASSLEASLICEEIDKVIAGILEDAPTASSHAAYVKDHWVTIEAQDPHTISEIWLYEKLIQEKLQEKFPTAKIKGLRYLLISSDK
mgnify:CR=1 FL=1